MAKELQSQHHYANKTKHKKYPSLYSNKLLVTQFHKWKQSFCSFSKFMISWWFFNLSLSGEKCELHPKKEC